jgi:phage/plasmid-like protein (TIGR03299 family)
MSPIDSHVCTVRSDTGITLGVVGKGYTPVQNSELFEWLRGLEGFSNVIIETAGSLGVGETVWVLGRCKDLTLDIRGDVTNGYMLLSNGHNGQRKLTIMPTQVRVVCANTLRMAESTGERKSTLSTGFLLRHTSGIQDNMRQIQEAYAKTTEAWKLTEEALRLLAAKPLSESLLTRLFNEPWKAPTTPVAPSVVPEDPVAALAAPDEGARAAAIRIAREQRLQAILAGPTCQVIGTRDTLFSAFNAVTEYLDYETPTRQKDPSKAAMARFESSCFGGTADEVKNRAFKLALELAGA